MSCVSQKDKIVAPTVPLGMHLLRSVCLWVVVVCMCVCVSAYLLKISPFGPTFNLKTAKYIFIFLFFFLLHLGSQVLQELVVR